MTTTNEKTADIKVTQEPNGSFTIEAATEAGVAYLEKQICFGAVAVNVSHWSEALKHIIAARAWKLSVNDRGHLIAGA
jgi:hypothetical protein